MPDGYEDDGLPSGMDADAKELLRKLRADADE
jgi:hypothetical protein